MKLREGRTQQIRKMFQAVGHPVSKLKRVAIGPIADPKLTPGVWRELTKHEVKLLATLKDMPVKPRRVAAKRRRREAPGAQKRPTKRRSEARAARRRRQARRDDAQDNRAQPRRRRRGSR